MRPRPVTQKPLTPALWTRAAAAAAWVALVGAQALAQGAAPEERCAATKIAAAGRGAAGRLRCHARASGNGRVAAPTCLVTASADLRVAFMRAEGRGGCATRGDRDAAEATLDAAVAEVVAALPGAGKCPASKLKAAGRAANGMLRCHAKATRRRVSVSAACVGRAGSKLEVAFARAEERGDCVTSGDAIARRSRIEALVADIVAFLLGVPGVTTTTSTTTSTTTTTVPGGDVARFAADVQPIFTASCTFPGCHVAGFLTEGLVLTPPAAHGALVDRDSVECPAFKRVRPGSPDESYLLFKLMGSGPCFVGQQMPLGHPPLSATDVATIADWIRGGARDD